MKTPRDISGAELVKKLVKLGFVVTRQKGSHIRISKESDNGTHLITIPNHSPIKIGLLAKIIPEIVLHLEISKEALINFLSE